MPAGASAVQVIPAIQPQVQSLTVFQHTTQSTHANIDCYFAPTSPF
jgi:cation diffusion facilitator CzcD-associated flavoprotein CzcO